MNKFCLALAVASVFYLATRTSAQTVPSAATPNVTQTKLDTHIEGLTAAPESDLLQYLRERRLLPDEPTDTDKLAKAEDGIKDFLARYGYRHAQVTSRLETKSDDTAVVSFLISEGPGVAISEIRFKGNRIFSSDLLAKNIGACLNSYQKDRAQVFNEDVFEYCQHQLANFERTQGYLQAGFSETKVDEVAGGLIITLYAEEGILYRLGQVEIEGADHISEQVMRTLIDMRAGDIANGEKLAKAIYEELRAMYGEKGFIQYTAEITPEFHSQQSAAEGTVDFKITIDEGKRFKVHKISFKAEDISDAALRQLMLLREGDVYNQKLFEQSVRKINETGLFNFLDQDKDVDYRTNEEEKLVDLVIKLTKKSS
jgi:outer membrane protein insertion porin family